MNTTKNAIIGSLTQTLKDFQTLSSIEVTYGDDVEGVSNPLDIIVSSVISVEDIANYRGFHKKLLEDVSTIMPSYSPCWYVHEVIWILAPGGKKIPGGFIETLLYPEKNIHEIKAVNLLEERD